MMTQKFKEYRMFWICLILFIVFGGLTIVNVINSEKRMAIGLGMLSLIALYLLLLRYKMTLFDDMMIIYEWKIFAMLPTVIEYKDIQSIEKKSKHHLLLQHQRKSHIYVFDTDTFIQSYQTLKKETH